MSLKSRLVDIKRLAEHFWAWDLKPVFGKDVPSQWIVGKIKGKYVLLEKFSPSVGYFPQSDTISTENFFSFGSRRLLWSKTIHAYVNMCYDACSEMTDILLEEPLSAAKSKSYVFSSYEEANMHAVLQGLSDRVIPFEDFEKCMQLRGFINCDIDCASIYIVEVKRFTNELLKNLAGMKNELDKISNSFEVTV